MIEQQIEITPKPKEKRAVTTVERLLLPIALAIAVLFDRIVINMMFESDAALLVGAGAFWLCYLGIFYAIYWKRLRRDGVLWFVAVCAAALCAWSFFYDRFSEYGFLTFLVVPSILMAHAQMTAGQYDLKNTGRMAVAWFLGWFVKPFSGIYALFEAAGSLIDGGRRQIAKKVALSVVIVLPLLCVIVPLLSSADQVFGYYIEQIVAGWNLSSLVGHTIVVAIAFILFYSFLWNVGFGKQRDAASGDNSDYGMRELSIDAIIGGIVLGTVILVYVLFCGVQFTYLFAGAGLPTGMTYSAYAREGFAQTVIVCAINLLIFGVFLDMAKAAS